MSDIYKNVLLDLIKNNPDLLGQVKYQTEEMCLIAVRQKGWALLHVIEQTPDICLTSVRQDGAVLKYVKQQTEDICIAAVRQFGRALYYVKEQTPEICMIAVQQDGRALKYVYNDNQTEEICIIAVKHPCIRSRFRELDHALKYVKNQTHKICDVAVSCDGRSLRFVNDNLKTDDIVLTACLQTRKALQHTANKPFSLVLDCLIVIEKDKHLIDKGKEVLPKILVERWLSDHIKIKN